MPRTLRVREPEAKTERVRDPVHGLIVFDKNSRPDVTAWKLLNTPEMQRLRRIRQLGVSEMTFPGATHTRFAHSLGVFHVARQLLGILRGLQKPNEDDSDRYAIAVFAALLHDLGHGPFSHAFEEVQKARGEAKHHEEWTAEIILREVPLGDIGVRSILDRFRPGMAESVAELLRADYPDDVYGAVVSSSFDADRLDYLQRDRKMTGSGAGAIDFDWLKDNLRLGSVPLAADDDTASSETVQTFCLSGKAYQAAEAFVLARYHLYEQVYFHKTTRGIEKLVGKVIGAIADAAANGDAARIGLDAGDPLVIFFAQGGATLENYLNLDDYLVWAAASRMAAAPSGRPQELARRMLGRQRLCSLDIERVLPQGAGESDEDVDARRRRAVQAVDAEFAGNPTISKDSFKLDAYGEIGSDVTKAHKRLNVLGSDDTPREITEVSRVIRALRRREVVRYYFEAEADRNRAVQIVRQAG